MVKPYAVRLGRHHSEDKGIDVTLFYIIMCNSKGTLNKLLPLFVFYIYVIAIERSCKYYALNLSTMLDILNYIELYTCLMNLIHRGSVEWLPVFLI